MKKDSFLKIMRLVCYVGVMTLCFELFLPSSLAWTPGPSLRIEAKQRYPWNGRVDIVFTVEDMDATSGTVAFSAKDAETGEDLGLITLYDEAGASMSATGTPVNVGTHRWVWDADWDVPDGFETQNAIITGSFNAGYWYVDGETGMDSNNGRSWEKAKKSIQAAILASSDGDIILVAPGTYSPIDTENKAIVIRSVNGAANTIIDGGGNSSCATICRDSSDAGYGKTILRGFTFQRGYVNADGGSAGALRGTFYQCIFRNNTGRGYGTACAIKSAIAYNCLFYENKYVGVNGIFGGGVAMHSQLVNCTIANNSSWGTWDCNKLNNSIVWGNTRDVYISEGATDCTPYFSCFKRDTVGGYTSGRYAGIGCIFEDPLFVDSANRDYQLSASSPCIGAGMNEYASDNDGDLEWNERVIGEVIDLGAYEYKPLEDE